MDERITDENARDLQRAIDNPSGQVINLHLSGTRSLDESGFIKAARLGDGMTASDIAKPGGFRRHHVAPLVTTNPSASYREYVDTPLSHIVRQKPHIDDARMILSEVSFVFDKEDLAAEKERPFTFAHASVCLICMISSTLSGYDQGVIAAAMREMKFDLDLDEVQVETSIGILNIAAAVGGVLAGPVADAIGRRKTIAVSNLLFLCGSVFLTFATSFWMVLVGRIVMGVGVGASLVVPAIYTAEIAPASVRGSLVAANDLADNLGILLGYAVGLLFWDTESSWREMFGLGIMPCIVVLFGIWFVPESPRWLLYRGDVSQATIELLRLGSTLDQVEKDTGKILEGLKHAKEGSEASPTWCDVLFPQSKLYRAMIYTGLGVAFFSQACGTEAIVYYSPMIMEKVGLHDKLALQGTMLVGACKVAFLVLSTNLFDRLGRKPMLIVSALGLTIAFIIEALSYSLDQPVLSVVGLCIAMSAFSIGFSPLTYVVPTEVFPTSVRGKAMSIALFTTRILAGVISLSFLTLQTLMTPVGLWLSFATISAVSAIFVCSHVPETMGKSLEEIESIFKQRVRASESLLPLV